MKTALITASVILYTAIVSLGTAWIVAPQKVRRLAAPESISAYEFYQLPALEEYRASHEHSSQ